MSARKSLIINSPYEPPARHWQQGAGTTLTLVEGRRPAAYEVFDTRNNTRRVEELKLVNRIRERVQAWREADYPGVTQVTRGLLEHWQDRGARTLPFYFCQIEAIETLIWWVEATAEFKQGIFLEGDGGPWERICNKMATGSGKTTVMAMIITWQVLNALAYPKRNKEFSRAVFIVAPGLTVRERLQVLLPGHPANVYDEFGLCPSEALRQKLNRAEVLIENWHSLMPLKQADRSVVKKGAESDEAFTRRVLGKLASCKDLIVINDEAHHAYRKPADIKISKKDAEERGIDLEEATRWIEGLDRLHKTRRIIRCFDLSATPFAPTGKTNTDEGLFSWIVSDFGLNDAIEGGLVKTPRVVVRDSALPNKQLRSKLYHLYREAEVSDDLNRKGAKPEDALPKLVQDAYTLLGADWREAASQWAQAGHTSPPVMLTVCNRTETAARIERYFTSGDAFWPELHAPDKTLRVDSRVLEKAEVGETAAADKDYEARLRAIVASAGLPADREAELLSGTKEDVLRTIVDNVGKRGTAGQNLQNVISVAMLSEGWDAKNVTHIMGLRAFTSQLLCEQVIGRGLRRVSYETDDNGLFIPEYVNVFGVPLSIFQDAEDGGEPPPPPKPSVQIEALSERNSLEIRWPNVLRVDPVVKPVLAVRWDEVATLALKPEDTPISADIAPALGGVTDWSKIHVIDLELLPEAFRLQRLTFLAARKAFDQMKDTFKGGRDYLVFQLIRLVEAFIASDRLVVPGLFHQDPLRKRILLTLNIDRIVEHLMRYVYEHNAERVELVFDEDMPIGSTRIMRTWYTTKPNVATVKSQVSHVVGDSTWEGYAANVFESSNAVSSYVKNDHLGFQIHYMWNGSRRRFLPDFLIRLSNGKTLVLEIKGVDDDQNRAKRSALAAWVQGVNQKGGFGVWVHDVAFAPHQIQDILRRAGTA
ncbi:MAG: type III restriction endonuclease subunit R [Xanthomonadales bacterium]|nr:type III restriction endonuclease subunit R [Xanthomonadales bacterium]MCZ2095897.1 DEAD/DEAH box helicase family protein [Anaerolineae bacterium]MDL1867996.1 type III restriction endonuclease subunit R [Gammaproteobacteria bacterium PRO6]